MSGATLTTVVVDWEAAEEIAERLGANTRRLVAGRHVEAAQEWSLRMARDNTETRDPQRSLSYFELAVVLGHREPAVKDGAGREWRELEQEVQRLAGAIRAKALDEAVDRAKTGSLVDPGELAEDGD
jgi:hypothetical protein